jgi:hypothetical protein
MATWPSLGIVALSRKRSAMTAMKIAAVLLEINGDGGVFVCTIIAPPVVTLNPLKHQAQLNHAPK